MKKIVTLLLVLVLVVAMAAPAMALTSTTTSVPKDRNVTWSDGNIYKFETTTSASTSRATAEAYFRKNAKLSVYLAATVVNSDNEFIVTVEDSDLVTAQTVSASVTPTTGYKFSSASANYTLNGGNFISATVE